MDDVHPKDCNLLGTASDKLLAEAEALFWRALRLEIVSVINCLHEILRAKPSIIELDENHPSYLDLRKRLSIRTIPYIRAWWPFSNPIDPKDGGEVEIARRVLMGENEIGGARGILYDRLIGFDLMWDAEHLEKPLDYRLARMVLTGAGLLDVDKLVEYRSPQFPSQCGEPQLGVLKDRVEHRRDGSMDVQYISLTCNDCGKVFRAPFYECSAGCRHKDYKDTGETFAVCAACYLNTEHDTQHLRKRGLRYALSEKVAKELCQCPGVENPLRVVIDFEDPEHWEDLFDERQKSGRTLEGHVKHCQYLRMEGKRRAVIEAVNEQEDRDQQNKLQEQDKTYSQPLGDRLLKAFPNFTRNRYFPMGNVHSAIMFGPLIIENGVKHTKGGAVISCREPPDLGVKYQTIKGLYKEERDNLDMILIVSGNAKRELFSAKLPILRRRRLNASVKQIVGGLFSGHERSWARMEGSVIDAVLQAAQAYKPGLTQQHNRTQTENLLRAADAVVEALKATIAETVRSYLRLLVGRFHKSELSLRWDMRSNNCQMFCDSIILVPALTTVFPAHRQASATEQTLPNYLLSFAARFPALSDEGFVTSRLDSYFRSFHQELDIIDTYELENESAPTATPSHDDPDILQCHRLLLWDCMNQSCNLADHIWRHVSDSASTLQFHLLRPHAAYTIGHWSTEPQSASSQPRLDYHQWLRQRTQVLLGIDILNGLAAGIAKAFRHMENHVRREEQDGRSSGANRPKERAGSRWGEWKPGSSSEVGRHGPEMMAETKEGEVLVLESLDR